MAGDPRGRGDPTPQGRGLETWGRGAPRSHAHAPSSRLRGAGAGVGRGEQRGGGGAGAAVRTAALHAGTVFRRAGGPSPQPPRPPARPANKRGQRLLVSAESARCPRETRGKGLLPDVPEGSKFYGGFAGGAWVSKSLVLRAGFEPAT